MAPIELNWLFKKRTAITDGEEKKEPAKVTKAATSIQLVSVDTALTEATLEDHDAWIRHLSQPNRPLKRAGFAVKDEYEQWLVARVSMRLAAPPSDDAADAAPADAPASPSKPENPTPDCSAG
jgi:hypothetical protein